MADNYSLNDYVSVGGGGGLNDMVPQSVSSFTAKWVGGYHVFWAIMIVIMIVIIASLSGAIASLKTTLAGRQSFMPTSTMWGASQDQTNVGGSRTQNFYAMRPDQKNQAYGGVWERIDTTAPVPMAAHDAQSTYSVPDPGTDALAQSPNAYTNAQILSSSEFNCASRKPATSNSWDWMMGVASEPFGNPVTGAYFITGPGKPVGDNQFSQILAGH